MKAIQFRSGGRVTVTSSPAAVKKDKSVAKRRLFPLQQQQLQQQRQDPQSLPSSSNYFRRRPVETPATAASTSNPIQYDEDTIENMLKVVTGLLKSECRIYAVSGFTKPEYESLNFRSCEANMEFALENLFYERYKYEFKAHFQVLQGVRASEYDGEAIYLKIGRKKILRDQARPFTLIFQCLFGGRGCNIPKFGSHRRGTPTKVNRPWLIVNDPSNIFRLIQKTLLSSLKIYITEPRPVVGNDVKLFGGRCFIIQVAQKLVDLESSSMLLSCCYNSPSDQDEDLDVECTIPLVYFKEFVSHTTIEHATSANAIELFHQLFDSFAGPLPMQHDSPVNKFYFSDLKFESKGRVTKISAGTLTPELFYEIFESLTRFSQS